MKYGHHNPPLQGRGNQAGRVTENMFGFSKRDAKFVTRAKRREINTRKGSSFFWCLSSPGRLGKETARSASASGMPKGVGCWPCFFTNAVFDRTSSEQSTEKLQSVRARRARCRINRRRWAARCRQTRQGGIVTQQRAAWTPCTSATNFSLRFCHPLPYLTNLPRQPPKNK